jgi:transposase
MNKHTHVVYLGIDVHKKTYSVTAVQDKVVVKRATMPAIPETLLSFIRNHFPNCKVFTAYEAGFSGFGLHRFLLKHHIQSLVVHAGSIEIAINNRSKTDKRDSEKIAFQLSQGKLQSVNVPSVQRENWRSVTRVRLQLVKHKTQTASQIKSLLHYFGILPHNHSKRTSKRWLLNLLSELQDSIDKDILLCLRVLVNLWMYLDQSIKMTEKRISIQAREDFSIGSVYLEMKGIGLLSSRILANELDDLSQFHSQSALFSFVGLTPKEYSSGDRVKMGNISRMGNPIIRRILTESAWKAIQKDPYLMEVFERIQKNTGSRKKAITAIARKMIGIIRGKFNFKRKSDLKVAQCIS